MTSRIRIQSLGRILVLSMFMGCTTSRLAEARDLGDALGELLTGQGGERPLPSSVDAMVPPVAMRRMRFMLVFQSYLPPQRRSRSAVLWQQGVQCSNVLHHL